MTQSENCDVLTKWNNHAATETKTMKRAYLTFFAIAFAITPVLGQTAQKIASINKKVIGKWVSVDKKRTCSRKRRRNS